MRPTPAAPADAVHGARRQPDCATDAGVPLRQPSEILQARRLGHDGQPPKHASIPYTSSSSHCLIVPLLTFVLHLPFTTTNSTIMATSATPKLTIAVTGGIGDIGRGILNHALAEGHTVVAIDHVSPDVAHGKLALHERLTYVQAELSDFDAFKNAVAGCNALIHLAAVYSLQDPKDPDGPLLRDVPEHVSVGSLLVVVVAVRQCKGVHVRAQAVGVAPGVPQVRRACGCGGGDAPASKRGPRRRRRFAEITNEMERGSTAD